MQYLITGGALAGSVLVLVACCSAISYAIKRRKQKGLSPVDISIQAKYLDTSRQISMMQHNTLPATTRNDVMLPPRQSHNNISAHQRHNDILLSPQRQSGCDTQTSQLFCETSFSSPSLGVSEDPLPSSRFVHFVSISEYLHNQYMSRCDGSMVKRLVLNLEVLG